LRHRLVSHIDRFFGLSSLWVNTKWPFARTGKQAVYLSDLLVLSVLPLSIALLAALSH
jgi:hypothetical protein